MFYWLTKLESAWKFALFLLPVCFLMTLLARLFPHWAEDLAIPPWLRLAGVYKISVGLGDWPPKPTICRVPHPSEEISTLLKRPASQATVLLCVN